MGKKKILYMCAFWLHGGVEKYMLNFFDHIDRTQYSFDVALTGMYKHENEDTLIERGINVIHYPVSSIGEQVREIRKILDAGNYDIVHVMLGQIALDTYIYFALVALAERKRHHYKVICHAHTTEDKTRTVPAVRKIARSIFRNTIRLGLSRADLLAACSREAGDFLYGRKRNVEIFYNGIDFKKFITASSSEKIPQWCEEYGIDSSRMNFLIVARMKDEKNPLFALNVIKALCRYYPNVDLIWVGDGEMRKDIETHIETLGIADRVRLLGVQDHVEEIMACCDYFFLPSRYEGAGIVLVEAQAAGKKCFTSNGVPKVGDCGGVSFIPLDKTAEQWAEEIHRQIESEPRANIDMERLNRFDIESTAAELNRVYTELVRC